MAVSKQMLGMNARNFIYIRRLNKPSRKRLADDKLMAKRALIAGDVPTPELLAEFRSFGDIRSFNWRSLPKSFVIKPARGYGGQGILVVRGWNGEAGRDTHGNPLTVEILESLIFDILDGAHSLDYVPDTAFIEERIIPSDTFKKLGIKGVPDIRVIASHGIPIMAMVRLPTIYSGGRANLHLGALGVGIDLRTGITTHGILFGKPVETIPGTKSKVRGTKIPHWDDILHIAMRTQQATRLGYVGVDIVIDKHKGPQVLEVNARPGLSIQLANKASLRTRLERVDDLSVSSPEHGVEIAKNLFAEKQLALRMPHQENVLHVVEKVTLFGPKKKKTVRAKIDTGAYRTAVDADLIAELGLDTHTRRVQVRAGAGSQERSTAYVEFRLRGKRIKTLAAYSDRGHMRFPIIIGRRNLKGFLVDPSKVHPPTTSKQPHTTTVAKTETAVPDEEADEIAE